MGGSRRSVGQQPEGTACLAGLEGGLCGGGGPLGWERGGGDLCLERAFRGSVGDRPMEMRLEETSVEAKAGSKAGYIYGLGERKQVSWRRFR